MKKAPITSLVIAGGLVLSANSMAFAATSSDIVKSGQQYMDKPYLYGAPIGDVNEFDCSSFTATVFRNNGITLPRTSSDQSHVGTAVQKANLQVGDLVFFNTDFNGTIDHVGIYIGAGQMISAILSGVKISNVNSTYWAPRYVTARRVQNPGSSTATTPSSATSTPTVHTVKSGDTLSIISLQYGILVSDLKRLNNLTSDTIFPGQTLKLKGTTIPVSNSTGSSTTKTTTPTTAKPISVPTVEPVTYKPTPQTTYKVQSGDSLWKIAHKFNLSIASLEAINKLKNDRIRVGQTLSLKKPTTTSTPKPTPLVNKTPAKTVPIENLTQQKTTKASTTSTATYVVKKGDTLSKVAYKNKLPLTDLIAFNHLSSSLIYPGQKLKLSKPSAAPADNKIKIASVESQVKVTSVKEPAVQETTSLTYTVKKGDSLWDIALLNNTNTKKLMKANNLNSPFIFPGQKLNLI
jgi:LysM repeat protein